MRVSFLVFFLFVLSIWDASAQCVFKPLDESFIDHRYYSLSYVEKHEQADWVCYRLTKNMIKGTAQRKDNFKADGKIKTGSAALADYKGSGYDRGHLAPAADFKFSQTAMDQSFYMSNMSPQNPSFNRDIWKKLEELMRAWAYEYGSLDIVTGPIFESSNSIGVNKVTIPSHYFKAALRKTDLGYEAIAFILPNRKSQSSLQSFVISVDDLEERIQIDLFHELADSEENAVEALYAKNNWIWSTTGLPKIESDNKSSQNITTQQRKSTVKSSDRRTTSVQCRGTTKKGARCKNKTLNGSGFCHLHGG